MEMELRQMIGGSQRKSEIWLVCFVWDAKKPESDQNSGL